MPPRVEPEPLPETLSAAVRHFADEDLATRFVARLRWPSGSRCPRCGSQASSYLKTRRLWKCGACKKQYSVKLGTIFEGSRLGFDKWLPAVWWVANSPRGISTHELARQIGVTQKTAWLMVGRIRRAREAAESKPRTVADFLRQGP